MAAEQVKVKVDGEERLYSVGTTFYDIAQEFQKTKEHDIVLVSENGRLRELHKYVTAPCSIALITTQDKMGFDCYRRSMSLLLIKAIYHEGGHENIDKAWIHFSVGSGYYCTIEGKLELNQSFLDQVKTYMKKLIQEGKRIDKKSVNTDDAITIFGEYGMTDKEKLFHYRRVSKVNIYGIGDFEDYNYGYMVPDTSYLKYFDLKLYDEGFVLMMPNRKQPAQLPEFIHSKKIFEVQKDSLKWGKRLDVSTVGDLNEYIVKKQIQDLILIHEALWEKKIGQIAEQIAADPQIKMVMVAGPSSSGKTTFSHRLSIQLSAHGLKPHPIPVDNYFINRDQTPLDENGKHNFECLEALDVELFNHDMKALLEGQKVELPYYNFKTGKREYRGDYRILGTDDILVIEGIHCLNERMSYALPKENKFKIYISALTQLNIDEHNRIPTTDGRLLRRIVRDARTRGTAARDTIAMWESVRSGEESYIFPYQDEADVMFNSALIYEFAVLKIHAEPLLFGIGRTEPEYQEAKRLLKFLDYFVGIPEVSIPVNSILREFIGGSCFNV